MMTIIPLLLAQVVEFVTKYIQASEQERVELEKNAYASIAALNGEKDSVHADIAARDAATEAAISAEASKQVSEAAVAATEKVEEETKP